MLFNIFNFKAKGVQVHFETSAEQIHLPGKGQKLRGKGVVCREPYRYEPFPKTDRCSGLKFNIHWVCTCTRPGHTWACLPPLWAFVESLESSKI